MVLLPMSYALDVYKPPIGLDRAEAAFVSLFISFLLSVVIFTVYAGQYHTRHADKVKPPLTDLLGMLEIVPLSIGMGILLSPIHWTWLCGIPLTGIIITLAYMRWRLPKLERATGVDKTIAPPHSC